MIKNLKQWEICRHKFWELPEWNLPFYARATGETESQNGMEEWEGRNFVQINWCTAGRGEACLEGHSPFTVQKGDAFYVLPGIAIRYTALNSPWKTRWLAFDGPMAAAMMKSYGYPVLCKNVGAIPEELFRDCERGLKENSVQAMRHLVSVMTEILGLMGGSLNDSEPDNRLVRRFIECVREHYTDHDININMIASMLGVHRSTLSRIVSQKMNVRPIRYLSQIRMQRSVSLLRNTDIPIREVAKQSGIKDTSHFSRVIHQETGLTPLELRKKVIL